VAQDKPNWIDRAIAAISPKWGMQRSKARLMARHYEAASYGRRTDGWSRRTTDANAAASGPALALLRAQARDLVRNNPWARRGLNRIVTSTVGWGLKPRATGAGEARISDLWRQWAETTQCDAASRCTMAGLQALVMRTVAMSGECLVRRRMRRLDDGLAVPMQLQVLEPDYLDTGRDGIKGEAGGMIVQGVEHDVIGRRVAYWLFDQHPGAVGALMSTSATLSPISRRIPADGVLHIFDIERPQQVRGASWFASVDLRLHDLDELEDATLMKSKIAACLAAFVTDADGSGAPLGEAGVDSRGEMIDTLEPGMITNLPTGKSVQFSQPPSTNDHATFTQTNLRGVAAGLGVTYEDLTGDYSQVNYSSARMARNAFMLDVWNWQWNMLIPQFCAPAWDWMIDAMLLAGEKIEDAPAEWTPAAIPMIDPGAEGQAMSRMVRIGAMTPDEMVRAQGYDPATHWSEYAANLKRLDKFGIIIDSDPRRTTAAGQIQSPTAPAKAAGPIAPTAPAAGPGSSQNPPTTDVPSENP
jgi:lambda family phage portal protein